MASFGRRNYLASWHTGGLITVAAQGLVIQEIGLDRWFPMFVHPEQSNELFVTALTGVELSADPYSVLHTAEGGVILHVRNGRPTVIASDLEYPTGIVAVEDLLYVADYLSSEVYVYTKAGERSSAEGGFHGPMGMAQAPNGDICVAEMDAGRIICRPIEWFHSAQ